MTVKDGIAHAISLATVLAEKKERGEIGDYAITGNYDRETEEFTIESKVATLGHAQFRVNFAQVGSTVEIKPARKEEPPVGSWWEHPSYENMFVEKVTNTDVVLVSLDRQHHSTVLLHHWPAAWVRIPTPNGDIYEQSEADVLTKKAHPLATHVRVFDSGKSQWSNDGGHIWYDQV